MVSTSKVRRLRNVCVWVAVCGCADNALVKAPTATAAGGDSGGTSTSQTDTAVSAPAWYALRGTLVVAGGLPVAEGSALEVEIVDADLTTVSCSAQVEAAAIVPVADNSGPLAAWWVADLSALELCAAVPTSIGVGIGELVPDVRARLGSVGLDDVADALFGAWSAEGGGAPLSFGYAATEADLTGDDVAALPAPDGVYGVESLYLSALPEEDEGAAP